MNPLQPTYVPPTTATVSHLNWKDRNKPHTYLIMGIVFGVTGVLLIEIILVFLYRKCHIRRQFRIKNPSFELMKM